MYILSLQRAYFVDLKKLSVVSLETTPELKNTNILLFPRERRTFRPGVPDQASHVHHQGGCRAHSTGPRGGHRSRGGQTLLLEQQRRPHSPIIATEEATLSS